MDGLALFWTATAKKQRNYVFDYWNNRNKSKNYSRKLNLSIRERTKLLKKNPEMGKKIDYAEMRSISMGHYSIIYKIAAEAIIIIAFWDNRQNPKKLLNFLKNN
ncbi:type II toxin-antitoxin system RelE/ParE family toxin [Flavimarina sp. Hel_I_48]|uniref:type II toxin-antitoxin system RelE/ParE family toxin n=1 Tax=Flavimarina sp. Hel_I_48 TaxID=1392488 RepID=UPI0004DF9A69|nr:type II toxin-antitoxin system RelE/ParE family toxin [Flavimarina sp. Hel_I_48]